MILSAGAINSAKILMLSGIGDEADLQSHGIQTVVDLRSPAESALVPWLLEARAEGGRLPELLSAPLDPTEGRPHQARRLDSADEESLRPLYALGGAWAVWIQAHREDWNAIADIPKVEAVLGRVVELGVGRPAKRPPDAADGRRRDRRHELRLTRAQLVLRRLRDRAVPNGIDPP